MTEITRKNFHENYSKIIDDLQSSVFTAVDCEFSGLMHTHRSLLNSPQERYDKLRTEMDNYTIIQIGISTFRNHKKPNQYISNSYTFHLVPSPSFHINAQLSFEMNSVQFLCKHAFDFNKILYRGLNYLNEKDEQKVTKMITEETIPLDRNLLDYIHSQCVRARESVTKTGDSFSLIIDDYYEDYVTYLVVQNVRKIPDLWATSDKSRTVTVKMVSKSEKRQLMTVEKNEMNLKKTLINSALGFTRIMKELKNLKKPLVGHNLLLDLMMIYKQFYSTLPESYKKFKKEITRIFPEVYDTKYLSYQLAKCITHPWKSTSLSDLYIYFKEGRGTSIALYMPFIEHGHQNYTETVKFHEGGFDSFCTGFIFIKMAYLFLIWDAKKLEFSSTAWPLNSSWLFSQVFVMRNRLNMARIPIPYVDLDGSDPGPKPMAFLYIENVQGKPIDVAQISAEVDKYTSAEVKKLGKCCGLIVVLNESQVGKVMELYKKRKEFRVCRYNALKHSPWTRIWPLAGGLATLLAIYVCYRQGCTFIT